MNSVVFDKIQNLVTNLQKNQVMNLFAQVYGKDTQLLPEQYHSIIMEMPENQHVYVMYDVNSGYIYGIAVLIIEKSFLYGGKSIGNITEFIITREFRRKGYGTFFLQYIERMAKYLYCRLIRISIRYSSDIITSFCVKNGYYICCANIYEKKLGK